MMTSAFRVPFVASGDSAGDDETGETAGDVAVAGAADTGAFCPTYSGVAFTGYYSATVSCHCCERLYFRQSNGRSPVFVVSSLVRSGKPVFRHASSSGVWMWYEGAELRWLVANAGSVSNSNQLASAVGSATQRSARTWAYCPSGVAGWEVRSAEVWIAEATDVACAPADVWPPNPPPPLPPHQPGGSSLCENTCRNAYQNTCDDGGPGAEYSSCACGTE